MSFWSPGVSIPVIQDFVPVSNGLYSIGSSALRWKDGWFSGEVNITTKLQIGGITGATYKAYFYSNSAVENIVVRQDGVGDVIKLTGAAGSLLWRLAPSGIIISNGLQAGTAVTTYQVAGVNIGFIGSREAVTGIVAAGFAIRSEGSLYLLANGNSQQVELDGANSKAIFGTSICRGIKTVAAATNTIGNSDTWVIVNNAGVCTLTFPAAASFVGREITVRTITANTVVSASANVVPLVGGAAGTAILAATAGKWATLVSDGANWQIMAGN